MSRRVQKVEGDRIAQDRTPGVRNGACSTFFPSVQIDM